MAGSMSDFLENEILDHILSAATYTAPATVYIGLWTSALTDASTGATAGEVSGGSYARVAVTNNATNWPAASGGSKSNGADFTFPTATAGWGTVTHFAILDSATLGAGNILYWADLTVSKTVSNGDIVKFATGSITITQG
jgi:hypothetical protein